MQPGKHMPQHTPLVKDLDLDVVLNNSKKHNIRKD